MKQIIATMVLLAMTLGVGQAQTQEHFLTILHLNDSHSNLLAGSPRSSSDAGLVGGVARVATIVKGEYLNELPPVLLHAGDAFIGDPMFNIPVLGAGMCPEFEALKALGCNAMTLGNHEFDATPAALEAALYTSFGTPPDYTNGSAIPMLSANIEYQPNSTSSLMLHVHSSIIIDRGPFKIGVIGLTTPATNQTSQPKPIRFKGETPEEFVAMLTEVGGVVEDLLMNGCNYVVLLSHMGMELDKEIAANVPFIDLIVGGHDHIPTYKPVHVHNVISNKKVEIVQTAGFYRQVGKIVLSLKNGKIGIDDYNLIDLDASIAEDQDMLDGLALASGIVEGNIPGLLTQPITSCTCTFTELATGLTHP